MSAITLGQLIDRHGVDVLAHLDRDVEVPVLDGLQVQGDLAVIPAGTPAVRDAQQTVPRDGIAVIAAMGAGHEHRLLAGTPGTVYWAPVPGGGLDLGQLDAYAPAYIAHPEHGYLGIASGSYVLRRQREQADEERMIAD